MLGSEIVQTISVDGNNIVLNDINKENKDLPRAISGVVNLKSGEIALEYATEIPTWPAVILLLNYDYSYEQQVASTVLLNISEAAKLMGVCENTLRDWDSEGKFVAERTEGNHRRYSLDKVREYIEEKESKKEVESLPKNEHVKITDELQEKYSKYLINIDKSQHKTLAILLDNIDWSFDLQHQQLMSDKSFNSQKLITKEQILELTATAWNKFRFKSMVGIQPFKAPCSMVYYNDIDVKNDTLTIRSLASVARTKKYYFSCYYDNFDIMKDTYASALAGELENIILEVLPNIESNIIDNLQDKTELFNDFDYVIGPQHLLDKLESLKNVDLYPIPSILEPKSFNLVMKSGKYVKSNYVFPIFCPYVLYLSGPTVLSGGTTIEYTTPMIRYNIVENAQHNPNE